MKYILPIGLLLLCVACGNKAKETEAQQQADETQIPEQIAYDESYDETSQYSSESVNQWEKNTLLTSLVKITLHCHL